MSLSSNANKIRKPLRSAGSVATRNWRWMLLLAVLVLVGAAAQLLHMRRERMERRLLTALPDAMLADPQLVRFANQWARPLYLKHCVQCHASDLHGDPRIGTPDLTDDRWLFGDGSVYEIERTLLYGIRNGAGKSRGLDEMPAYGLRGMLNDAQVRDVVQYLLKLNDWHYRPEAANDGRVLFEGAANCGDCHGPDARGNAAYGVPDLTRLIWKSADESQSLYNTIYFGQRHIMPGWRRTLSLGQIRALAVYVYAASHPPHSRPGPGTDLPAGTLQ